MRVAEQNLHALLATENLFVGQLHAILASEITRHIEIVIRSIHHILVHLTNGTQKQGSIRIVVFSQSTFLDIDTRDEYATAAFNLNDTKKVSNIVETDDGFHIIQLIEKRGDRINTRHILLRPKVADKDLTDAIVRLDSVRADIESGKFTFEQSALYLSQDKDSRNNNGIMLNEETHSNRFKMAELPAEVGKLIDKMKVGEISKPFVMVNPKTRREQVAIVKLHKQIEGHKADLAEDYQMLKGIYENHKKAEIIENWVKEKQRSTYVYIDENWRNCEFRYEWMKN